MTRVRILAVLGRTSGPCIGKLGTVVATGPSMVDVRIDGASVGAWPAGQVLTVFADELEPLVVERAEERLEQGHEDTRRAVREMNGGAR